MPTPRPMPAAKKILFVCNDAGFFISHRLPLAIAARAQGYEVSIATHKNRVADRLIEEGLAVHPVPFSRSGMNPVNELRVIIALYRLYRRLRPDLVHHITIKPVLYGGLMARLARVPAMVNAISGMGFVFINPSLKVRLIRAMVRAWYRQVLAHPRHTVIFQNPDDMTYFIEHGLTDQAHAVLIKGSGVDMQQFSPVVRAPRENNVIITFASRMLWDKGVGEFVKAARAVRAKHPGARFLLIGNADPGNPRSVSVTQLKQWHDSGAVEWLGFQANMAPRLQETDIFCLPSYREGMPKALVEAAACGCALITTDAPGCREVVSDGDNGLLVPVQAVDELAHAMNILIENPQKRLAMGERARARVERDYALETVTRAHMDIYHNLLG